MTKEMVAKRALKKVISCMFEVKRGCCCCGSGAPLGVEVLSMNRGGVRLQKVEVWGSDEGGRKKAQMYRQASVRERRQAGAHVRGGQRKSGVREMRLQQRTSSLGNRKV